MLHQLVMHDLCELVENRGHEEEKRGQREDCIVCALHSSVMYPFSQNKAQLKWMESHVHIHTLKDRI